MLSSITLASSRAAVAKSTIRKTLNRSLATQTNAAASSSTTRTNNKNGRGRGGRQSSSSWNKLNIATALGLSAVTATSVTLMDEQYQLQLKQPTQFLKPQTMVPRKDTSPTTIPEQPRLNSPPPRPDLPIYTREEVSEHCDEDSLWYTFRGEYKLVVWFYLLLFVCCRKTLCPSNSCFSHSSSLFSFR